MFASLHSKLAGHEYVLRDVTLEVKGEFVHKTFVIDVLASGGYYLSAWVMATNGSQDTNRMQVYLDGNDEPIGHFEMSRTGWQSATMQSVAPKPVDKRISLSAGTHTITFECKAPEVPEVESVRLSEGKAGARLTDTRYSAYVKDLRQRSLPADYARLREQVGQRFLLDNPQGDYIHEVNVNFSYTFYKTFYFTAGTQVVFETKKADPYASDPYMYLFRCNEPIYLSTWADDDGGAGRQSKISATIQNTDFYILLVRAYNSSYPGTSDLWKDGSLYASDIPVAGTALYCGDIVTSDSLNFFTCRLIGDSRLWLQSYYTGNGIVAYNDDYGGPGDFGWGMASRVRARVYRIRYAIASAYQSAIPTGTCDVFMCCRDSAVMSSFPKLKADDAIRSAPESSAYNCISWAGGRTDLGRYFWPPDSANPWRGATDLESFDNFFGNRKGGQTLVRYNGAMNYTRNGANTGNAAVALWALNGKYTHASVTKPGNDHPHGYDWESKPGGLMRTFHPRDALEGDGYGAIVAYYRWDGTRSYGTPPAAPATEGTQEPMAEVERAEFGEADQQKLHELLRRVPDEVIQEFDRLYQAWAKTWNDPQLQIHSDPRMFARSLEYESLVAYCRERGRMVWPLLFDRYFRGDELTMNPIEDLTFAEHPNLMTETREKNLRPATGAIPSQSANWARYVSGILSLLYDDLVLGRD